MTEPKIKLGFAAYDGNDNGKTEIIIEYNVPKSTALIILNNLDENGDIPFAVMEDFIEELGEDMEDDDDFPMPCDMNDAEPVDMERILDLKDEIEGYDVSVPIPKKEMRRIYKEFADILDLPTTKEYNEDSDGGEWFCFKNGTFLKPDEDIAQYVLGWSP